ncbi:MAG: hypothetical protein ACXWP1_02175, partial [Bdellovibrionota bacterium]
SLFATNAHAADVQKFVRTSLVYFMEGPGDFAQPWMKERCDEADQARAEQSAAQAAQADCEKAPGTKDCLVKYTRINVNGPLSDDLISKYGLSPNHSGYGYWGCEAEALVYGL